MSEEVVLDDALDDELSDLDELREDGRLYFGCSECGWEGKSNNKLHLAGMCPQCQTKNLDLIGLITYFEDEGENQE